MKRRCIWCNGSGDDLKQIVLTSVNRLGVKTRDRTFLVHPQHEEAFIAFNSRVKKFGLLFLILVGVCLISMAVMQAVFLRSSPAYALLGIGVSTFMLGGLLVFFPFSTPETAAMFGVQRSVRIVRVLGVLVAAGGVLVSALYLP